MSADPIITDPVAPSCTLASASPVIVDPVAAYCGTYAPPAPIPGCTDPTASNYNPLATVSDGSCVYAPPPVVVAPLSLTTSGTDGVQGEPGNPVGFAALLLSSVYNAVPGRTLTYLWQQTGGAATCTIHNATSANASADTWSNGGTYLFTVTLNDGFQTVSANLTINVRYAP